MIIWGSKGRTKTLSTGSFYCPSCGTNRQYKHKSLGKYFTLYFIPIFKTSDIAEYIECSSCLTPYETSILKVVNKDRNGVAEIILGVKREIDAGLPLNIIYQKMLSSGASEEIANRVIAAASNGQMKQCKVCKYIYSASLSFCSNCGRSLEPILEK